MKKLLFIFIIFFIVLNLAFSIDLVKANESSGYKDDGSFEIILSDDTGKELLAFTIQPLVNDGNYHFHMGLYHNGQSYKFTPTTWDKVDNSNKKYKLMALKNEAMDIGSLVLYEYNFKNNSSVFRGSETIENTTDFFCSSVYSLLIDKLLVLTIANVEQTGIKELDTFIYKLKIPTEEINRLTDEYMVFLKKFLQ